MSIPTDCHIAKRLTAEEDEYMAMQYSLALYKPREIVKKEILAAYNDPTWDWTKCDGCTGVSELHFGRGRKFPPCVAHDHLCELERRSLCTRAYADKILLWGHLDYGVNPVRAWARYAGVRGYWFLWGSARH